MTSELNRNLPEDPEVNDRKRVKRAAREVSKDMLRGHIPENKTVCPEDERTCLLTLESFGFKPFLFTMAYIQIGLTLRVQKPRFSTEWEYDG